MSDQRERARFCYVVMCHTDPEGMARTLRRIRRLSPRADILVRHHVPGLVPQELLDETGASALHSDIEIVWGDWSMTLAALEAFAHVRRTTAADHVVLLSGQDYPVRDLADWERQVVDSGADALVDVFPPMPDDWRYRWWTVQPPHLGPTLARRVAKGVWWRIAPAFRPAVMFYQGRRDPRWGLGVRRLELLLGRPPVSVLKGSLWMTLSARAVDSLLRAHREDAGARAFFERVRIPDESYLQSLLLADPSLRVMDCPTTYARFPYDQWSPVWVDEAELEVAARTPCAFVRKIPEGVDPAVVAAADRLSERSPGQVPPVRDSVPGQAKLTGSETAPGVPSVVPGLPERRSAHAAA